MTSSTSRTLRKAGAVALSLALAMSTLAVTPAEAAAKVKLAKTKITVKVGKTKKVKVKGVKAKKVKKITVKSSKKAVAVAKKVSKVKIKVTGKKKGTATVKVNLKLKKKVGGKKKYNLKLAVTVKKAAATPTEAPVVTPVPTQAPVVTGQGISMVKKTETVATGASVVLTAQLTPADSNDVVEWSVQNAAVAKVEPASDASGSAATLVASGAAAAVAGKAYAKVTGLTEGVTQITAKVGGFTDVCTVTVIKNTVVAVLQSVKQTKADTVEMTFDIDTNKSTTKITKDQIEVNLVNADKKTTNTIPVNKIAVSADGKIITASLGSAFTDKGTYQIGYNGIYKDLTASVGAVTSVALLTASAEKGVPTKIEYALYDAAGIDVTAAHTLNTECTIEATGDGTVDNSHAANATVTFDTVGQKAEITVTYKNSATTPETTITGKGTITCVAATAKNGTPRFKTIGTEGIKNWDDVVVAKFYAGSDSTNIKVVENSTETFYFCAQDKDGSIINYDGGYEVTSSNDNVVTAEVESNGRFAKITVTGVGANKTANINVTAKANDVDSKYVVPVSVLATPVLKTVSITVDKATITNAQDIDYFATFSAKASGSNGDMTGAVDWSFSISKAQVKDLAGNDVSNNSVAVVDADGYNGGDGTWKTEFYPVFDEIGSYTIQATATFDGVEKSSTKVVKVESTGVTENEGVYSYANKVTYKAQNDTARDISIGWQQGETARIYAVNSNSKFLGYVDYDSTEDAYTIGDNFLAMSGIGNNYRINKVEFSVSHAGIYINPTTITSGALVKYDYNAFNISDGNDYLNKKADVVNEGTIVNIDYVGASQGGNNPDLIEGNFGYDVVFAKPGDTKVEFTVTRNEVDAKTGKNKTDSLPAKITVSNKTTFPTVTVGNTKVSDLGSDAAVNAMSTNVDMNCPASTHESITNLDLDRAYLTTNSDTKEKTWNYSTIDWTKSSVTVKYAYVYEGGFYYAVQVGETFEEA